jgi:hypothetical protein
MKVFNEQSNIGKAKYVVNFHDGVAKNQDGSPFFDIKIFNNKTKKSAFVKSLIEQGYVYGDYDTLTSQSRDLAKKKSHRKTFFSQLKDGDNAVSEDHGLVSVLFIEEREGGRFITCQANDENETTFDAIEGELYCPKEWQISTAIDSCEARIDNGATTEDAFKWLREEVCKVNKGEFTYDFN